MKKLLTITFFCLAIISCATNTQSKSTVVNTSVYTDGNIYTTITFSKITSVDVIDMTTKDRRTLEPKDYNYDASQCLLELNVPAEKNACYSVKGNYLAGRLQLKDAKREPLLLLNGTKLISGKDFVFDSQSASVEFCTPIDFDKDSYVVFYLTSSGECVFGNVYNKFEDYYQDQITNYLKG